MKGNYIIILFILTLLITPGCSSKERPEILSKKVIEVPDDRSEIECKKITYSSDGLEVVGYLVKPKDIEGKLPVIIYNRGGNRETGKITDKIAIRYFGFLASKNYAVFASQYRGNDGGEGKEEFGGSDLNDVLNLIEIAKGLPYVNKEQIFMIGASRGGLMTYMACKESNDIRAAAIISGVSDTIQGYYESIPCMKNVLVQLIGSTPQEKEEEYIKRSAYYWADEINVPLLIIHGSDDRRVEVSQAEKMGEELKKYGKDYKLIIYPKEGHVLRDNWSEAHREIFKWFNKYKDS